MSRVVAITRQSSSTVTQRDDQIERRQQVRNGPRDRVDYPCDVTDVAPDRAGFDAASRQSPDERMIAGMTAGNLAVSQAAMRLIPDGLPHAEGGELETIHSVPTMFAAAARVSEVVRRNHRTHMEP